MRPYKFVISGGGTGGHIYPAIAIADELKRRHPDAEILFVGAKDRMEMQKVPQAGYRIEGLWISGIRRNLTIKNLAFPLKLASSIIKSKSILRKFRPDVAVGTGGYASAPLLRVATMRKIPSLIQEQNSYAGITNKWLKNKVQKICVAYDNMDAFFPAEKIVVTGNPVRQDLLDVSINRNAAIERFNLDASKKTLLVLGGSLGARRINQLVDEALEFFIKENIQLIWQCGKLYEDEYLSRSADNVQVHAFLDTMNLAYAAADIIISRAGALSVSELCLVGKPVVFIPSPNVAEDHQTKNAEAISEAGGAILLKEKDAATNFETIISELIHSEDRQRELSENIKKLAKPNATSDIVDEIEKLIKQ